MKFAKFSSLEKAPEKHPSFSCLLKVATRRENSIKLKLDEQQDIACDKLNELSR